MHYLPRYLHGHQNFSPDHGFSRRSMPILRHQNHLQTAWPIERHFSDALQASATRKGVFRAGCGHNNSLALLSPIRSINWILNGYLDFGISGLRCNFSRMIDPKNSKRFKTRAKNAPLKSKEKKNDRKDSNNRKSLLSRIVKHLRLMTDLP